MLKLNPLLYAGIVFIILLFINGLLAIVFGIIILGIPVLNWLFIALGIILFGCVFHTLLVALGTTCTGPLFNGLLIAFAVYILIPVFIAGILFILGIVIFACIIGLYPVFIIGVCGVVFHTLFPTVLLFLIFIAWIWACNACICPYTLGIGPGPFGTVLNPGIVLGILAAAAAIGVCNPANACAADVYILVPAAFIFIPFIPLVPFINPCVPLIVFIFIPPKLLLFILLFTNSALYTLSCAVDTLYLIWDGKLFHNPISRLSVVPNCVVLGYPPFLVILSIIAFLFIDQISCISGNHNVFTINTLPSTYLTATSVGFI